jgi:hypothetical protein
MALESFPKISPANFSPENDLIQVYSKKGDYVGVINPSYIGGSTSPSGVAGAIQFSNGSAFASDASNLFWDDTNNRLGVGTNAPNHLTEFLGAGMNIPSSITSPVNLFLSSNFSGAGLKLGLGTIQSTQGGGAGTTSFALNINPFGGNVNVNTTTNLGAQFGIKGSGSTSATTSLLVQNSLGDTSLKVNDNQLVEGFSGSLVRFKLGYNGSTGQAISTRDGQFALGLIDTDQLAAIRFLTLGTGASYIDAYSEGTSKAANYPLFIGSRTNNASTLVAGSTTEENGTRVVFGSAVSDASALVQINSTTRGFLPPRMTTTQKNAIASPAAGLVVYDSTTNKLCCYNGSTWNDLF